MPLDPPPGWFETRVVAPGVTMIREPFVHPFFRANAYRIEGSDFDIQFDFGVGVCRLEAALPPSPRPVLAIASHAHVDHVGSFHAFARRAGHAAEQDVFATMADRGTVASWFMAQEGAVERPPHGFAIGSFALVAAPLTQTLGEGEMVDTGTRRLRVLHLPGHSPGSIALLDEADGSFFSGDAIYDDDLVDDVPGADVTAYCATMRRLAGLDIGVGFGGHGEAFGRERMREIALGYLRLRAG